MKNKKIKIKTSKEGLVEIGKIWMDAARESSDTF